MSSAPTRSISLEDLCEGIRNLTPERGSAFCQAASFCFDSQGHLSGVHLKVDGICTDTFEVTFPNVTDKIRASWRDATEATDDGATGIAILLIRSITGMTVIERSFIGSGIDWLIGPEDTDDELIFQNNARLEVSGILNGTDSQIKQRVKQKLAQTDQSDSWNMSAYVVVVEFSRPFSKVVEK